MVVVRFMMRCSRLGSLVRFLLVTVRIRRVVRRVGVITVTRMRMRLRMMRGSSRSGVLFTVMVARVSVRVGGGAMTVIFVGRERSTGRVRVRVVRVAALVMASPVLVTLPLGVMVMRRCMRLLVPICARVTVFMFVFLPVLVPVLVPVFVAMLVRAALPLLLLLGGSFRLCLLGLPLGRSASVPLLLKIVESLSMCCIVCIVVVVVVMRPFVIRVSVPVLLSLASVLVLLLMSVLRLLVCSVRGVFGFVALLDFFAPPSMRFSSLVDLALALRPGLLVLFPLPLTLRRPVLLLLLGLVPLLLYLALLLLFRGMVIVLMAMMMSVTMSGCQHDRDGRMRRARRGGLDVRRHRRSLSRGTMERKEWRGVECIGWRGGDRGRGESERPKWIFERHLGAVDERPLLIHLSHIPAFIVQALVSSSSYLVQADEGSSVRQIATEVVDDEEGESDDAEEREGQGADGLDSEGLI